MTLETLMPIGAPPLASPASRALASRALDWRFLLPAPPGGAFARLVFLGAPDGVVDHALELGIARTASYQPLDGARPDAIVCLHGALEQLPAALRRLEPGGMLYAEVTRGAPRTLQWLRRTLRDEGLVETGIYWCRPDFARRDAYVPLHAARALGWYLSTLYAESTARALLRALVLRAFAPIVGARRLAPVIKCCAITAIKRPSRTSTTASSLGFDTPELRQGGMAPLILTPRNRRIVVLPFATAAALPRVVLKVSRWPQRNAVTENEQRVLSELRGRLDHELRSSIPAPLGNASWGPLVVGAESAIPGRPLSVAARRWPRSTGQHRRDFRMVADWLTEFHRQTELSRLPWGGSDAARTLASTIATYQELVGSATAERSLFVEVLRRSVALADAAFPTAWTHADLTPSNVARSRDRIGVFDWAGGRPGLPVVDLINFAASWYREVRRDRDGLRTFSAIFLGPDDAVTTEVRDGILRYAAALGIAREFVPVLAVRHWCELATYTFHRDREPDRLARDMIEANVFARYLRQIAAHQDVFFARWAPADEGRAMEIRPEAGRA
jgi:thiamine kinase-like enzyme